MKRSSIIFPLVFVASLVLCLSGCISATRANGTTTVSSPSVTVKMYVNAPFEDAKAQNRFDLLAAPAWSDVIKDKIWDFGGGEVYIEPNGERHIINGKPVIYENGEARYINIGHDDVWGSSLSILMKNNDGIVPYNPNSLFSYSAKQKALNYGSSTPINLFWKIGQWIEYFHSNLYNQ